MQAKPPLKWVGGKTQLLPKLLEIFPRKISHYFEPFLGGGAVFWALANEKQFQRASLSDTNADLINVYRVIRDYPDELMDWLRAEEVSYAEDPATRYGQLRNPGPTWDFSHSLDQAGRFIFLNKSCFNGLYRVNGKGGFNVPWGKKAKVRSFDPANIRACSQVLSDVESLNTLDFAQAVQGAGKDDLVYLDPPYVPLSPTSNFTSYSADGFGLAEQQRLADCFRQLSERGVLVVESNSDTEIVRDLYRGFEMHTVQARRAVNSKGTGRGPVGELIIVNRPSMPNLEGL